MAEGGAIIGALLRELETAVRPGITTKALDELCEDFICSHEGAVPAFKGLYGFPGAVCISVNERSCTGSRASGGRSRTVTSSRWTWA